MSISKYKFTIYTIEWKITNYNPTFDSTFYVVNITWN